MTADLLAGVGITEEAETVTHDFGSPWHLAIQGQTRSGKSVLSYGLLGDLARYPEVLVCGSDISSVLLAPFAELAPGWCALGTADMHQHVTVIEAVIAEMHRRIAGLYLARRDKLTNFSPDLPLLVVVLEEYPGLLEALEAEDLATGAKTGQRLKPRMSRAVASLVAQGAKVGIRVVLLAQRFEAGIIGGATRSNFGLRVSLRVDNQDSVRMLHPTAPPELLEKVEQFQPGQGILDRPGLPRTVFRARYVGDYARWVEHVLTHRYPKPPLSLSPCP